MVKAVLPLLSKHSRDPKSLAFPPALMVQAAFRKNAKARRVYQLPNKCRVSNIRRTEAYVPRGYSVKQVTLFAFSVEVPTSVAQEGEVFEVGPSRLQLHLFPLLAVFACSFTNAKKLLHTHIHVVFTARERKPCMWTLHAGAHVHTRVHCTRTPPTLGHTRARERYAFEHFL